MENLNLNLNKGADDVLTEAAGYFADQGYSVLNQGFAEIVSSPRLSKETYEKNLYTYLVLRHELLSIIKYIRSLLKLETLEVDEEKVDKSTTKNKSL